MLCYYFITNKSRNADHPDHQNISTVDLSESHPLPINNIDRSMFSAYNAIYNIIKYSN